MQLKKNIIIPTMLSCMLVAACNSKSPTADDVEALIFSVGGKNFIGENNSIKPFISDLELSNVKCTSEWVENYLSFGRDRKESVDVWTCYYDITGVTWRDGKVPTDRDLNSVSLRALAIINPLRRGLFHLKRDEKIIMYWWDEKWRMG